MNIRTASARATFGMIMMAAAIGLTACGGGGGGGEGTSAAAQSTSPTQQGPSATTPPTTNQAQQPAPAQSVSAGAVALQWVAPQENTDGTALQNLAGYTLVYGTKANVLDQSIRIANPSIDRYVVEQLPAGTYFFAVKAFNAMGAESGLSNVVSKIVS